MDEQWCSNDEDHSEKPTTELPQHFSRLEYELLERTYPSVALPLPPETQDLFDEAVSTLKPPEEWDLNPIPRINLDDGNLMDRVRFNGKGVEINLGPAGAVAAVLGMLLVGAAGGGDSERIRKAEREAEEARRAQEQQRLAREEAERKEKLERSLREL
jgi:hypothetical protein